MFGSFSRLGRFISNCFTVKRADAPVVLLDEVHHPCASDGRFIWRPRDGDLPLEETRVIRGPICKESYEESRNRAVA